MFLIWFYPIIPDIFKFLFPLPWLIIGLLMVLNTVIIHTVQQREPLQPVSSPENTWTYSQIKFLLNLTLTHYETLFSVLTFLKVHYYFIYLFFLHIFILLILSCLHHSYYFSLCGHLFCLIIRWSTVAVISQQVHEDYNSCLKTLC